MMRIVPTPLRRQDSQRRFARLVAKTVALGCAVVALSGAAVAVAQTSTESADHEFYFTRGIYSTMGDGDDWGPRWAIDYPEADQHFLVALKRLSGVDAYPSDNAVGIGATELRDFPFLYVVEAGALDLDELEADALRGYLEAGGFMVIDDFWGTWAWDNLVVQLEKVLPDAELVDVPLDHPVFHAFYDIRELLQVPNVAQASTGRTHEFDGYEPYARGVFDRQGRLMILINWNTDLGDAWEWADDEDYPLRYSTYAYEMGINMVIYGMTY
jgi:hypothetical protein